MVYSGHQPEDPCGAEGQSGTGGTAGNQNGKTLAWMIHIWIIPVWQIPIGKIPHKEILNKVIIKERNTHGIKYQSINLDGWGRECLSLLWTDGTDLV